MKLIAELCQNHNGEKNTLIEMATKALEAGATHAKIQNLYSFELTKRLEFENPNPSKFQMFRPFKTEVARLSKLDLSEEQELEFVNVCRKLGVIPMTTVFTYYGAERAKRAGFKHIKIASYNSTDLELIEYVADFSDELVISTGATTVLEIRSIIRFLHDSSLINKVTLLHCKTEYPNLLERVHLQRMNWLKEFGVEVGFSDHTLTFDEHAKPVPNRLLASKVALFLGATAIERHFTILAPSDTKDGRISITPEDLKELASFAKLSIEEKVLSLNLNEKLVQLIIDNKNLNFEPSVEEWFNRRYYQGRVTTVG